MSDWLAGFTAGLVMGVIFVGVGALILPAFQWEALALVRRIPLMRRAFAWAGAAMAAPFLWGGVGALLGIAYGAIRHAFPGQGLGSPNLFFTLAISLVAVAYLLVSVLRAGRAQWARLVLGLGFGGTFGWLLPWLAS